MTRSPSPRPFSTASFESVFERTFDVLVLGAGWSGFAAATTLAQSGRSTLLLEPSGDLLWESTRALENTAAMPADTADQRAWLDACGLGSQAGGPAEGPANAWFDAAQTEIRAAHTLANPSWPLCTLLYAVPVAVERRGGRLEALILATKSGPRRVQATYWVDASENGQLAQLAEPTLPRRQPSAVYRSAVLQSTAPEALDAALPALQRDHPDLQLLASNAPGERRLRWQEPLPPTDGSDIPPSARWYRRLPALISALRTQLGTSDPASTTTCLLSHAAMRSFPIYAPGNPESSGAACPENLSCLSPALRGETLVTPAERFALGMAEARAIHERADTWFDRPQARLQPATLPQPAVTHPPQAVLVAGAGTGGAIAAIAAGRSGVRTLVLDAAPYPGGVGTGAVICGYFHGARGGLQQEIDERTGAMSEQLTGQPAGLSGWHHEAKKIVLLTCFEEAGVRFQGDALLTGVQRDPDGRVLAADLALEGGLHRMPASAFIDGTGDGDLAALAGAGATTGRPGDGRSLSFSQSVLSLHTAGERLLLRGCNFDAGWVDPTDAEDLSRARLVGIAQHRAHASQNPAATERVVAVAPLLGLRQSRQIVTDYQVQMQDLVAHARFDDAIGEVATVADTHSVDFEFESDDLAFYYWTCRGFRHPLRSELPYRMLLPQGLTNLWLACRAAGITVGAAYGLRMQREVQRFGEAAGLAAALAARENTDARGIPIDALLTALSASGSRPLERLAPATPTTEQLLAALDQGAPGVHLWHLWQAGAAVADAVRQRLEAGPARVSFYAAAVLAMNSDPQAEARLIEAVRTRETGPTPDEHRVPGAFGQCIDLPFWLQAVLLLRKVGSAACLPALRALAAEPEAPLNVRTIQALTLERLARRLGPLDELLAALEDLTDDALPDPLLPPSRSLWLTLHHQPQKRLGNDRGAPVAEDHTWQLHLVIHRTRKNLGLPSAAAAETFTADARGFVRTAFAAATLERSHP